MTMTITHETRIAALAHHMAFFTIMAAETCEEDEAHDKTDMALDLWLDEHGYGDRELNIELALEALQASGPIMVAAIRKTSVDGAGHAVAAGRLILRWAEEAGLSRMQFIQQPMH